MSIAQDGVQYLPSNLKLPFSGPELATPRIGVRSGISDGDLSDIAENLCGEQESRPRGMSDGMSSLKKALSALLSPPMTEQKAADVMKQFMQQNGGGMSKAQMQQIADTGEFNGQPVSESVRNAANKMMANGGELFNKLDSANKPWEHDNYVAVVDIDVADQNQKLKGSTLQQIVSEFSKLLTPPMTEQKATDVIKQFMQQNGDGLTKKQMQQMANDGYVVRNGKAMRVSPDVQQAAQKMMANGGELFNKLDSANKPWEHDNLVALVDIDVAKQNQELKGSPLQQLLSALLKLLTPSMSEQNAADTMKQFMQDNDCGLTKDQMQQIANQGYFVKNGKPMRVSSDVQEAAKKMMANGGALFNKLDNANKPWEHDNYVAVVDVDVATANHDLSTTRELSAEKKDVLSKLTAYSRSSPSQYGDMV
jgi:predicted secreted protein